MLCEPSPKGEGSPSPLYPSALFWNGFLPTPVVRAAKLMAKTLKTLTISSMVVLFALNFSPASSSREEIYLRFQSELKSAEFRRVS
jgi:hypothetical protein